jgi:hypothetical protein
VPGAEFAHCLAMTDAAPATPNPSFRKALCPKCADEQNCDIRGSFAHQYADAGGMFWECTHWYILQCRGCETVFGQTVLTNSEDIDHEYRPDGSGAYDSFCVETIEGWPAISKRIRPNWMTDYRMINVPNAQKLRSSLSELYKALDNDLSMLTAIGIRTTFDIASELLGVDPSLSFADKTHALVDKSHIGPLDKIRLDTMVDAGSAVAHRGWLPDPTHLSTMMDMLEHFVHAAFVAPEQSQKLDKEAATVKAAVPPRAPKPPKSPS